MWAVKILGFILKAIGGAILLVMALALFCALVLALANPKNFFSVPGLLLAAFLYSSIGFSIGISLRWVGDLILKPAPLAPQLEEDPATGGWRRKFWRYWFWNDTNLS